ncbi:MAG: hypothetical protein OQL16_02385 [Gammaproteobacteria bacterium]|nr:hypothetical protein [Gammaproteobacteria bacterium]
MLKDHRIWTGLFAIILALLAFTRAIDDLGSQNTEDALVRALATYGVARTLNGVISVAQGTEVAIEPAGVGVILTPGQILDPINDLVERFSWVMLVSSASLGVLNVLLSISAWVWLSVTMTAALFGLMYFQWKGGQSHSLSSTFIKRAVIVLVILRFAAPAIAIANDVIYQQFLDPGYQVAVAELTQTTQRIAEISNEQAAPDTDTENEESLLGKARALYELTTQSIMHKIDMEARMQRYQQAASNASRHAIDLIVIFLFQTILLPVLFIWIVWHLLKWVLLGKVDFAIMIDKT